MEDLPIHHPGQWPDETWNKMRIGASFMQICFKKFMGRPSQIPPRFTSFSRTLMSLRRSKATHSFETHHYIPETLASPCNSYIISLLNGDWLRRSALLNSWHLLMLRRITALGVAEAPQWCSCSGFRESLQVHTIHRWKFHEIPHQQQVQYFWYTT